MRLQYLSIENITSLKGKHFIDFEEISKQSDLFAITGPTGSGKSTLLMAIAMALYGQNHKGLTAADLVTTHCPFGKIELQFILQGSTFNVKWNCQTLKKDGTARKTALIQRSWLRNGKECDADAENILGLNWEQFTKVIILNQGQFSEFLTSSFNKRKEILEKLMGHGQLEALSKMLRKKLIELDSEIQALEGQSDFAKLMTEDQYTQILKNKKSLELIVNVTSTLSKNFERINQNLKEDIKIKEKSLDVVKQNLSKQRDQEELQKELITANSKHKAALNQFEKQQTFYKERRPLLKSAIETRQNLKNVQVKQEEIKKSLSLLQESIKLKENKKKDISQEKSELETNIKELTHQVKEGIDLNIIHQQLNQLINLIDQERALKTTLTQLKSDKNEIESEGLELKNIIKSQVAKELIDKNHDLIKETQKQEIETLIANENFSEINLRIHEEIEKLEHLRTKARKSENTRKEVELKVSHLKGLLNDLGKDQEKIKKQIDQESKNLHQLEYKINSEEDELLHLKRINNKWRLLKQAFDNLKENKGDTHFDQSPCPVCESTRINWEHVFAPLKDESNKDIIAEQNKDLILKEIKEQRERTQIIMGQLRSQEKVSQSKQVELEESLLEMTNQLQLLNQNSLNEIEIEGIIKTFGHLNLNLENFKESRGRLIRNWKEVEKRIIDKESELKDFESKFIPLQVALIQYDSTIVEAIESRNTKKLQDIFNHLSKEIKLAQELKLAHEKINSKSNLLKEMEKDLLELGHQFNETKKNENDLNIEVTQYLNTIAIHSYPEHPQEELDLLETQLEQLRENKDSTLKLKTDQETLFRQGAEQINNLLDRIDEYEKLHLYYYTETQDLIHITRNDFSSLNHIEIPENFSQLLSSIIEDNKVFNHLEKFFQKPWFLKIENNKTKENISKSEEEFKIDQVFYLETILPFYEKIKNTFLALTQKNAALDQEIKTYNDQQSRIALLTKEITRKKEIQEEYSVLNHYIGKDRFRDYALAILENTLLDMANHEISSLASGRYELLHAKAGKKSEFMVKDNWHGGIERKVSTLSGGETFLLSLGLAMGLSDITRGQTEIDSFFIDEGFGTLDDESISQVLDCLMAIQSRGKQIGLISHVTGLTSQIPVRLEVIKNNFGESLIEIQ